MAHIRHAVLSALVCALLCPAALAQPDARLAARGKAAEQAMNERRFDDAAAEYRQMLKSMPNEPRLVTNLGMALALGGHYEDAIPTLQRAVALDPKSMQALTFLGSSYLDTGQPEKALVPLRTVTRLAPKMPQGWYSLGHAYNELAQATMATFNDRPEDQPWRQLLLADALMSDGRLVDAFALYRSTIERLPSVTGIHDSVARIYEQSEHSDWAAQERAAVTSSAADCVKTGPGPSEPRSPQASRTGPALSEPQASRRAWCEFRAGRYRAALDAARASDPESRYWRARAAVELAREAFKQLDSLPDSKERREMRAATARAERRYSDAIVDLEAALKFAPGDPRLLADLGTTYYFAKQYDKAVRTLVPLVKANADDPQLLATCGNALLQLQMIDAAIPLLQRSSALDTSDPSVRLSLANAYIAKEYFAAAVPLLELDLADDTDGSVHVQLARAYKGLGNDEKATALLTRSQELQKAAQERNAAKGQRAITPPR